MDNNSYLEKIERVYQLISTCPDPDKREADGGWSIKEVVGHLLDSLSNNHQRLLRYEEKGILDFPGYNQELFVKRANYQAFEFSTLVSLWYNYNKLLLHIYDSIPPENLSSTIKVGERPAVTIEQLMKDYFTHMENHERQVQSIIDAQT